MLRFLETRRKGKSRANDTKGLPGNTSQHFECGRGLALTNGQTVSSENYSSSEVFTIHGLVPMFTSYFNWLGWSGTVPWSIVRPQRVRRAKVGLQKQFDVGQGLLTRSSSAVDSSKSSARRRPSSK